MINDHAPVCEEALEEKNAAEAADEETDAPIKRNVKEAKEIYHTKVKEEAGPSIKQEIIIQEEKVKRLNNSKVKNEPMDNSDDMRKETMQDIDDNVKKPNKKKSKKKHDSDEEEDFKPEKKSKR